MVTLPGTPRVRGLQEITIRNHTNKYSNNNTNLILIVVIVIIADVLYYSPSIHKLRCVLQIAHGAPSLAMLIIPGLQTGHLTHSRRYHFLSQ